MPRGFVGRAASAYLTSAEQVHTRATTQTSRIATGVPVSPGATTRLLRTKTLPFNPEDARAGGPVPTGRGNSSNIVVRQEDYEAISWLINQADDRVGECMHNIACEIEALCQTVFVLPDAVPRCLNISDSVKRSLGQFRSVTEDALIRTRNFAREISEIGL